MCVVSFGYFFFYKEGAARDLYPLTLRCAFAMYRGLRWISAGFLCGVLCLHLCFFLGVGFCVLVGVFFCLLLSVVALSVLLCPLGPSVSAVIRPFL